MIRALAALLLGVALAGSPGCVTPSYVGGARPIDPARFSSESGWIVADPTPPLRQQRDDDCGPAVLAMVAARWSLVLTVEEIVEMLPPAGPQGTRLGDLRDLARDRGLIAFAVPGDQDTLVHELRAGRPVIVGLLLPYTKKRALSHYEVVVAAHPDNGQVVTIDPAIAKWRTRSWADLEAEWAPVGRPTLVVLGRTDDAAAPRTALRLQPR